jgi:hypothetical protein
MAAVPACNGIGSIRDTTLKDVSGSGHVVGSSTAGPVSGAAVLVGVGNMIVVSACDGIRSTRDTSLKDVSWGGRVVGSGTAGPVGWAGLLSGVGNMGGSGDRGAGNLGDGSTARVRGADRAVL